MKPYCVNIQMKAIAHFVFHTTENEIWDLLLLLTQAR